MKQTINSIILLFFSISVFVEANKVASLQVLKNHQPIKALKGMEIPEEAAINLKLKESVKGAFFCYGASRFGCSDLVV